MGILIGLIVGIFLTVGGVIAYRELKDKKQGYPYEQRIEEALLPYVYRAIMFAYKTSEARMDEFQERLHAVPKHLIAVKMYEMLPEKIQVGNYLVDIAFVKAIVSQEKFERILVSVFNTFANWYESAWDTYIGLLLEQLDEKPPGIDC